MTCRHFDREGLARAERGLPDPHVDDCADCQAARADYERVRAGLGESGAGFAPPAGWEARVFAAIDREPRASRRGWWLAGGALAIAAAALVWWQFGRTPTAAPPGQVAQLEILRGTAVVRGRSAAVGDGVRVTSPGDRAAIWIYRGDALALACSRVEDLSSTGTREGTCTLAGTVTTAELRDLRAATYHVVRAQTELRAPTTLDDALALLFRAEVTAVHEELIVE